MSNMLWTPVPDGKYLLDDPNGPTEIMGNGDTEAYPLIVCDDWSAFLELGMAVCRLTEVPDTPAIAPGVPSGVLHVIRVAMDLLRSDIAFDAITVSPDVLSHMKEARQWLETQHPTPD